MKKPASCCESGVSAHAIVVCNFSLGVCRDEAAPWGECVPTVRRHPNVIRCHELLNVRGRPKLPVAGARIFAYDACVACCQNVNMDGSPDRGPPVNTFRPEKCSQGVPCWETPCEHFLSGDPLNVFRRDNCSWGGPLLEGAPFHCLSRKTKKGRVGTPCEDYSGLMANEGLGCIGAQ